MGEVVRSAGGWLFDQVMAGWDVTVITADCADPRPLRILGVRPRELDAIFTSANLGPCLESIAVLTDLYDSDERVRRMVLAAAEAGNAEVRLWGDMVPVDFDDGAAPISHTLSLAARAFKAHAMAAASMPAEPAADTEVFRRGQIRRRGLVSVR
jgi:hypothetical protein